MTNQAAQTMPSIATLPFVTAGQVQRYRAESLRVEAHRNELLNQVAALSQTAGVAREPTREHIEAFKRAEIKCVADYDDQMSPEYRGLEAVFAMLAAAPAASGGEDGWPLAMRVREALDRVSCPDHFMRIAVETITGDAPHPPSGASQSSNPNPVTPGLSSESGASVSERAWELPESLRTEIFNAFDDITGLCRYLREGGPVDDDLNGLNEGLQEAIHIAGGMMARMSEPVCEPPPEDVKRRARELLAEAERGPQNDYGTVHRGIAHRALEQALTQQRGSAFAIWPTLPPVQRWKMERGSDGLRWSVYMDHCKLGEWVKWEEIQQAWFAHGLALNQAATTPQPGAEALRQIRFLIDQWEACAVTCDDDAKRLGHEPVANELRRDSAQYRQCAQQLRTAFESLLTSPTTGADGEGG